MRWITGHMIRLRDAVLSLVLPLIPDQKVNLDTPTASRNQHRRPSLRNPSRRTQH